MPKIGMLRPVFAKITAEPENATLTYGTGKVIGHAMNAGVAYTRNDAPLYADNTIVENDNSVTGAELTLGVDDVADADQVDLLGMEKTGEAGSEVYEVTSDSAPYVGVGFVEVRQKNGVARFIANWFHKVQFAIPDESTTTKGEKLEWQCPTLKGKVMGVYLDGTGKLRFRKSRNCATLTEANAWLDTLAHIASGE